MTNQVVLDDLGCRVEQVWADTVPKTDSLNLLPRLDIF